MPTAATATAPTPIRFRPTRLDPTHRRAWGWASPVLPGNAAPTEAAVQEVAHGLMQGPGGAPADATVFDSIALDGAVQAALGVKLGDARWAVGLKVEDPAAFDALKLGKVASLTIARPKGKATPVRVAKAARDFTAHYTASSAPALDFLTALAAQPGPAPIAKGAAPTARDMTDHAGLLLLAAEGLPQPKARPAPKPTPGRLRAHAGVLLAEAEGRRDDTAGRTDPTPLPALTPAIVAAARHAAATDRHRRPVAPPVQANEAGLVRAAREMAAAEAARLRAQRVR